MVLFDPETHTYTVNGERYPSVTGILKACGCVNDRWFTEESSERGRQIHEVFRYWLTDHVDLAENEDERAHLAALKRFLKESHFKPEQVEIPVVRAMPRYAGTLDVFGMVQGQGVAVDWKTGAPKPADAVQLGAYVAALWEQKITVFEGWVVYFDPAVASGYKVGLRMQTHELLHQGNLFHNILIVYNWRLANGLIEERMTA